MLPLSPSWLYQLPETVRLIDFGFATSVGDVGEYEKIKEAPSKSGLPHRHITITFSKDKIFGEWERIALQFMFGSDPVRESMNVLRAVAGEEKPTRLFELLSKGENQP